jgi:hypothetical protein
MLVNMISTLAANLMGTRLGRCLKAGPMQHSTANAGPLGDSHAAARDPSRPADRIEADNLGSLTAGCLLTQYPIDTRPPDPQPAGDFRGPDAIGLQSGYLGGLSPRSRHTPFVAALTLGLCDPFTLTLQHGLPFGLPHSADHGQHQPADRGAGVERLVAGH